MATQTEKQGRFNWKGFVSLTLAFAFTLLVVSGIFLYVSPRGRVANWGGWTLAGLGKDQWSALHMGAALVILVIASLHLYFNWKVLWHYIRSRTKTGLNLKVELALALVITALTLAAAVWDLPPVSKLQEWNHAIKDFWEVREPAAPVPHAEELTFAELAEQFGVSLEDARAALVANGYLEPDGADRVADIADLNHVTPETIGRAIQRQAGRGGGPGGGGHGGGHGGGSGSGGAAGGGGGGGSLRGLGRLTVGDFCRESGRSVADILTFLESQGVTATESDRFRDVAESMDLSPRELERLLNDR